jgi:hypothetical protein
VNHAAIASNDAKRMMGWAQARSGNGRISGGGDDGSGMVTMVVIVG